MSHIPIGTYTFTNEEGEHKSFRVTKFEKGSLRGKTCIGLCHGDKRPTLFAFIFDSKVRMWKKFYGNNKIKWWCSFFRKIIDCNLFKEDDEHIKETIPMSRRLYTVEFRKYIRSIG